MSSYLTFYLVPKKTRISCTCNEDGTYEEKEVELSKGLPLTLTSYSRSSDIYRAFNETLNPEYAGVEDKYTELTYEGSQQVIKYLKRELESTEQRLEIDYKMLKEGGYNSDLWEEIQSFEKYLIEQKEVLSEAEYISSIVYEVGEGYSDFEKVLINIS